MAIEQVNTSDFDYDEMLATIEAAYVGKADITISEYDSTAACVVKVGSKFEVGGALLKVLTADETPTGYSGISVSTTFYLYYDVSGAEFIFSETAPTWSDANQGWYNGADRAFFSMYKDSGGTLYEDKLVLIHKSKNQISGGLQTDNMILKTKVLEIGDWDMSSTYSVNVTHGLTRTKIRSVDILIRSDSDGTMTSLIYTVKSGLNAGVTSGTYELNNGAPTVIKCIRFDDGAFNSSSWSNTSFNRGWITIVYEV